MRASLVRTVSQMVPRMPTCLPTNRPAEMPSVTGSRKLFQPMPANETPALAKAKIGSTA